MIGLLTKIAETPWLSLVVGTVIGLIGIGLSLVLYRRGKINPQLSYVSVEVEILAVGNATWEPDLDIRYKGVQVPRLTAGRIGIWNSGNTTIGYDQVIAADPIALRVPTDCRLLVCIPYQVSRKILGIRIDEVGDNHAVVKFDYLDPGDGFVLHTAQSSPRGAISVSGTIKGLPLGIKKFPIEDRLLSTLAKSSIFPFVFMITGLLIVGSLASYARSSLAVVRDSWQDVALTVILLAGVLLFSLSSIFLIRLAQKRRVAHIPKTILTDPVLSTSLGL